MTSSELKCFLDEKVALYNHIRNMTQTDQKISYIALSTASILKRSSKDCRTPTKSTTVQKRYLHAMSKFLRKNGFCNVLTHQYELYNSRTAFVRNEQGSGMYENTSNGNESKLPTQQHLKPHKKGAIMCYLFNLILLHQLCESNPYSL